MKKNQSNSEAFIKEFTEEILFNISRDYPGKLSPAVHPETISVIRRSQKKSPVRRPAKLRILNLGKLQPLIDDIGIKLIECPGPRKFVLVKTLNSTRVTKIMLKEKEIRGIIHEFSKFTRRPLEGDIFTARAGNLDLTAVLSSVAGSRFILSKYS
jgi:hypothetical protein